MNASDRPVKAKRKFCSKPVVGAIGQLAYGYDGERLVIVLVGLGGKTS